MDRYIEQKERTEAGTFAYHDVTLLNETRLLKVLEYAANFLPCGKCPAREGCSHQCVEGLVAYMKGSDHEVE